MLTETLLSNNVEFFNLLITNAIFLRDYLTVRRLRLLYNLSVSDAAIRNEYCLIGRIGNLQERMAYRCAS